MTTATDLRSLRVQDYHHMVATGILAAGERVEFIDGQLAFPDCEMVVRECLRSGEQR